MSRFLWGTTDGAKKSSFGGLGSGMFAHWLGDLGLKRLRDFNVAFLCKWF